MLAGRWLQSEPLWPQEWTQQAKRIESSLARFSDDISPWWPGWSPIHRTVKPEPFASVRSCIYRMHDCIHQLWPLTDPRDSQEQWLLAQMAGEVAVRSQY